MTDQPAVDAPRPGFVGNLLDLYLAPRQAFAGILGRPGSWWVPLVLWLALSLGFAGFWLSKLEPREFMKAQFEEAGVWDKIPAERRDQIVDRLAQSMPRRVLLFSAAFPVLTFFVVSGCCLVVFAFLIGADVKFPQVASVVGWSYFAVALIVAPLTLVLLAMKGDWNYPIQLVLQANLSVLLDRATSAPVLYLVADLVDLFLFWSLFLLATGLGVASRRTTGAALGPVAGLWVAWVVVKIVLMTLLPGLMGR
jgi:hypothetical protein